MKYCIKCGKEIADNAIFCQHCGEKQVENKTESQSAPVPSKPSDHTFAITLLMFAIVAVGCILFWMYAYPLDNDKECYDAGKEAHESLHELNWYGHNYECSESCPVCHPATWRWSIRKLRMGL